MSEFTVRNNTIMFCVSDTNGEKTPNYFLLEAIEDLNHNPIEQIYGLIGAFSAVPMARIVPPPKGSKQESFIKAVENGKEWFRNNKRLIADKVCGSYEKLQSISKNKTNLVLAISELIASLSFGFSPVLISVLVVKEGLNKLCAK